MNDALMYRVLRRSSYLAGYEDGRPRWVPDPGSAGVYSRHLAEAELRVLARAYGIVDAVLEPDFDSLQWAA